MSLKAQLTASRVDALRNKDNIRKSAMVSVLSAITQFEKDQSSSLVDGIISDNQVISIIEKAIKQRKESIIQFKEGSRQDLVDKEQGEIDVLNEFMPEKLSDEDILKIVKDAIKDLDATSIKQMGSVVNKVRPFLQGKADMGKVSLTIKSLLANS